MDLRDIGQVPKSWPTHLRQKWNRGKLHLP